MKTRLITAAVLAGGLALSVSGASAADATLDGAKTTSLEVTAAAAAQSHDANLVSLDDVDVVNCKPGAECSVLTFLYKPAKGVKGDLMMGATWSNPASDMDLYFAEVLKDGSREEIGHCASAGGPSEKLFVPADALKVGKTYAVVTYFFRSAAETVTSKVEINVPDSTKTTVPADADEFTALNCTL